MDTRVADVQVLGAWPASFDVALCWIGLVLPRDPLRSLRQARAERRDGGHLIAVAFGRPNVTLASAS